MVGGFRAERVIPERIQSYLAAAPDLAPRYAKLRRYASGIVGTNYDISARCNLRCEGCLYFEGADNQGHLDDRTDEEWDRFFATERGRGVNFPYLAGAEPSLAGDRLRLAARHFERGVVFTNGSVRIDRGLPFRIHVSLWGTPKQTKLWRNGNSFARALRNYRDDGRALFVFTVNGQNIADLTTVVEICADNGVRLCFNLYSPTERYKSKLQARIENDDLYFRVSNEDTNLAFDASSLARARRTIEEAIDRFPDTVIYSRDYNRWVTDPHPLYDLDPETGWALDCEIRKSRSHRHIRVDLTTGNSKCCSPNVACSDCRAYAMAMGNAVSRFRRFAATAEGFRAWISIADLWARIFLPNWDSLDSSADALAPTRVQLRGEAVHHPQYEPRA